MKNNALEKEKNRAFIKAISRNLSELPLEEQHRLTDGMKDVPQRQMLDQIQYMENIMLPKIKEKRGEESEDYKFYSSLCNSLLWACLVHDRYDAILTRAASLELTNEFLREQLVQARKDLDRFGAAEDLIMSQTLNKYAQAISKRAEALLNNK